MLKKFMMAYESLKPEGHRRWKDDADPLASICRLWGGLWKQVSKIKNSFFETTREIPLTHRRFKGIFLLKLVALTARFSSRSPT